MDRILPTHIEAVRQEPRVDQVLTDEQLVLTDEQLVLGGLVPVKSWMRTTRTKNAGRVAAYKDRRRSDGVRQINLLAHEQLHETLRMMAKVDRQSISRVCEIVKSALSDANGQNPAASEEIERLRREIAHLMQERAKDRALVADGMRWRAMPGWLRRIAEMFVRRGT